MNYIKKLEKENASLTDKSIDATMQIYDLRRYLLSDKFRCGDELDQYVNIQDVLNRLDCIESALDRP